MFREFLKSNILVNFLTDIFKKKKNEKEASEPMKSATKIFIKIRTITDDEIIGNLKNFNNNLIDLSDAYFVTNPKLIFPTLVIRMEDSLKISEIQENEGFFIDGDFMGKKEDKKSDLVHFECKNGESESFNVKESKNWDQFKANEQLFGIKSSFDESQYTVVLDKNSEFYKKNVEHAKKLAQEILSKKCTDRHRMEERGHFYDINEEEKYSSVLNDRKKRNGLIKKKETFRKESLRNGESKDYPHRPSSPIKENFRKESTRNGESKDYPHRPSSPIKENFKKE
ncbi:LsmAD domain-containing protein, partial [Hamiltosporidium tvaerminnensis]